MKTLLIIKFSLLFFLGTSAQTYITQVKTEEEKLWGYINHKGEMISPPIYKKCYPFAENGLAAVYTAKMYSFINTKGQIIGTKLDDFLLQKGFIGFGGLQGFYDGMAAVGKNKKWGYLNSQGDLAIDLRYERVSIFNGGFATVNRDGKFFVINKNGEETEIEDTDLFEVKRFSEGLAPFTTHDKQSGFINVDGKVVVPAKFITVGYFAHGMSWAKRSDKKVGFIDKSGEWVIQPQFDAAKAFDPVSGLARVKKDDHWFYVDKSGHQIEIDDTTFWGDFSEGLARGKKYGKTGYYDKDGEWIITPEYDGGRDFKNGFAAVKKDGSWGFISQKGEWIIQPMYDGVKDMELVK